MYKLSTRETFCASHTLKNHTGQCRNLHGHNYVTEVDIHVSTLKSDGMVIDFTDVKRLIHKLDHAFICNMNSVVDRDFADVCKLHGSKVYYVDFNTTAENLSKHIAELLVAELKRVLPYSENLRVDVSLWETEKHKASYSLSE